VSRIGLDLFAALSNDTQEATCDLAAWTKEKPKSGFVIVVK